MSMKKMVLASVVGVSLTLAGGIAVGDAPKVPTDLSKKASNLRAGMTRSQVIASLGKATWAVLPGDMGDLALPDPSIKLELYWKNGGCPAVTVQFRKEGNEYVVTGWDEGRIDCSDKDYPAALLPPKMYSCAKSDRKKLCS